MPFPEESLTDWVDRHSACLVRITSDLVRIPSENTPPSGAEQGCQQYVAAFLRDLGWTPELYSLDEVSGLKEHPLFWPGRNYENRPNLGARKRGRRNGRSLLLSGHVDTVPRGTQPWTRDAFGGAVEGNRLFGRGANDMKAGVAVNLFVLQALRELRIPLAGDLLFETVVDEEFGGANGTLAGRLRGYNADAAIIAEPSFLRVCPAQRGGRIAHITLQAAGGVLTDKAFPSGVMDQLTVFLGAVSAFREQRRRNAPAHEMYQGHADPVPVAITKIFTAPWGNREPITVPEECRIEFYWQAMPGEPLDKVDGEFFEWMDGVCAAHPDVLPRRPKIEFPTRWLPGSAISGSEALVTEMAACAARVLGKQPPIAGIEGPCDMYIFHQGFGIPAVLWGGRGGNTHGADEYVDIDSILDAAKALLVFVCQWCGALAPERNA